MAMRVSGMMSGMDTETIIQQLVSARQVKVDSLKKKQTSLEWKQDAWKELNSKILKLYNGALNNLKYKGSFTKKTTTVSNSNLVSVITDDTAMDSVQQLKVSQMAKAGYLTGGKMKGKDGSELSSGSNVADSLGIEVGSKFEVKANGKTTEITIDADTTINSLVNQLKAAGVSANFDAGQQRLYIGAADLGKDADFTMTASNADGTDALNKLGILVYDDNVKKAYEAYANMSAGDQAKWVTDRRDALYAQYSSRRETLLAANKELEERRKSTVEAYKLDPTGNKIDIEDASARADYKKELEDKIAALNDKAKEEGRELTEEEKAEIGKYNAELSWINGYDEIQNSLDANEAELQDLINKGYLTADGDMGAALQGIAQGELDSKIATATDIVNGYKDLKGSEGANKQDGQDSEIELNGVTYTSSSNTFKVNGLTITCNGETAPGETVTLTTQNDTSGIYDMVKNFIKEYSALINEMDKLYNADSTKGYEPLTDEEKDAMSDSEIEKWESKIKDSILRRDSTLGTVSNMMKEIMMSGITVNGKTMYLSDFGIEKLSYFEAADNEKNAYHINGDEDDDLVKNNTNTLMAMINSDPDAVASFFSQLSQQLYDKMFKIMGTSDYSSFNKVYDDKKMKEDYDSYTTKIAQEEKKLQAYEDKWYKKFAAMETALAKMQSNASAVTSLLGGS